MFKLLRKKIIAILHSKMLFIWTGIPFYSRGMIKPYHHFFSGNMGSSVDRAYCGPFVTSLEMAGVSITVLHLDDTFRRCLGMVLVKPV